MAEQRVPNSHFFTDTLKNKQKLSEKNSVGNLENSQRFIEIQQVMNQEKWNFHIVERL